jgi:DNA repair protein RecO (recombination protein O)
MKFTDKAILLNRINYSESSLIITYYTLQNGIQKFLFQGGKKKANNLFPLSISEITYYSRPDSSLGKVTASETTQILSELPFHPIKSTIAFFIAEFLSKCLQTEEKEVLLFHFLEEKIIFLDKEKDISLFPIQFLLDFSEFLGIQPHVISKTGNYFNLMEGDISETKPIGDIFAQGEPVQLIHACLAKELDIQHTNKLRNETLDILIQYFQLHIPQFKTLKTLEVIREVLY